MVVNLDRGILYSSENYWMIGIHKNMDEFHDCNVECKRQTQKRKGINNLVWFHLYEVQKTSVRGQDSNYASGQLLGGNMRRLLGAGCVLLTDLGAGYTGVLCENFSNRTLRFVCFWYVCCTPWKVCLKEWKSLNKTCWKYLDKNYKI